MIPARSTATLGQLGAEYNRTDLKSRLDSIVLSIPPYTVRQVVAATTIDVNDDLICCDTTAGAFTVTLLPPDQVQFLKVTIVRVNAGGGNVTIGGTTSGTANRTLASQWSSITVQSTGSLWLRLASI